MQDQIDFPWPKPARPPRMVIGLCGRAQSGKTSVGNMLENQHGFLHFSFAHFLRQFITQLGVATDPMFQLERDKNKPLPWAGGRTPRYLMQTLGTEWGRQLIDPDLWVSHTMARVARHPDRHVVISDLRFDNEARAVYAAGGVIVEVQRNAAESHHTHVSERGISRGMIDAVIVNNSSITTLRHTVRGMVKMFQEDGMQSTKPIPPQGGKQ